MPTITARDAYYKGRRCTAEFADDALDKFSRKYCAHAWSGTCDLCNAWQNGYDRQVDLHRHNHIKACPAGYAAFHDECEYATADLTVADIVEAEVHSMTVAEVMADLFPVADSPADAVADADGVVHTATLPDGQVVTRTAPAGKYAAVLAVVAADGTWAARSWHLTAASAKRRSRHHRGSVPVPVSNGVTPGTAWADAPTDAPADSDIDATADALGAMLSAV